MVIYTEKVQVPGASVHDIYEKARSFVYKGIGIYMVQFWGDPAANTIHAKCGFRRKDWDQSDVNAGLLLQFDLMVACHDGYYEYTFTNFTDWPDWGPWKVEEEAGMSNKEKKAIRRDLKFNKWVDKQIRDNIDQLKQSM